MIKSNDSINKFDKEHNNVSDEFISVTLSSDNTSNCDSENNVKKRVYCHVYYLYFFSIVILLMVVIGFILLALDLFNKI